MEFLKIKYKEGLKDLQIGYKLGIDQSTVTRTRQRLVKNIARWDEWYKKLH